MKAESLQDILRVEGVNCKGFGVLPKFVMLDTDLSLEAKTIYSYFCSFAGNGSVAFPKRDTILSQLKIGKNTYYKYLKQLTENGYLLITQERLENSRFSKNIYTLTSNPKKFQESIIQNKSDAPRGRLIVSGLKSQGYGVIPKAVMIDPRLDIKSKGIYAYLCSLSGNGETAYPNKEKFLKDLSIGDSSYNKFLRPLVQLNYITVVQRHTNGRFGVNDYYLNDTPDEAVCVEDTPLKKQDSVIRDTEENPHEKIQHRAIRDTVKQVPEKILYRTIRDSVLLDANYEDTNINSSFNINSSLIKSINLSEDMMDEVCVNEKEKEPPLHELSRVGSSNAETEFSEMMDFVKCIIDYDILIDKGNSPEQINELVIFLTDVLVSKSPTFRVNKEDKPAAIVKKQLMRLSVEHIEYVLEQLKKQTGKIKNIRLYLLTALYNAPLTYETFLEQQIAQADAKILQ